MPFGSPREGVVLDSTPLESGDWKITANLFGRKVYLAQIHPQDLTQENQARIRLKAREVQQRILAGDQCEVDNVKPLLIFPNSQRSSGSYKVVGA
jgi:hypothetical protein